MIRIAGRSDEVETLIEGSRIVVFGVDRERANARNIGGLQRSNHGIFEEAATEALALP